MSMLALRSRAWSATALSALSLALTTTPARAGLDDYVKKADPAFAWKVVAERSVPGAKATTLKLTSQEWHGIRWEHMMSICEPSEIIYPDAALLFITGGAIGDQPRDRDLAFGLALGRLCGARVAVLPQVPNQPLLGGKKEDALIAETFVRYLETKDESWPLLFPMVKSAVKGMDAVQQWAKENGRPEIKRFVVTGASKRGWTTWLTGATDPRVVGIAPMVIDTLNMKAQMTHAQEVWGKMSEQIEDYTQRGLIKRFEDPDGEKLWKMVDPYSYRDRVTIPKLLINGLNDRYWTVDALNLYWDDLKGPKSVVYLPNAGHDLSVNRDYALNGLGAFFRHCVGDRPWPKLSWEYGDDGKDGLKLTVRSTPEPKSAKLWIARSSTRDFRESTWEPTPMTVNSSLSIGETTRPEKGYIALVGDLQYELDGLDYHLSTQVKETGAARSK